MKSTDRNPAKATSSGSGGVCMMRQTWRDEQHPSFVSFIADFLASNCFKLKFVSVAPDFIFNCGGSSVAFIFATSFDSDNVSQIFGRIQKMKHQFANLYVVCVLPTKEQNDLFARSYFKFGMELGKPAFVLVKDLEMGFEKMVRIAYSHGGKSSSLKLSHIKDFRMKCDDCRCYTVCKRQDISTKMKSEREQYVQTVGVFQRVVTSIPGIDSHDANALYQTAGSIEAIAKEAKERILENTDLSADKADLLSRFFRDSNLYLSPKIN